MTDVVTQTLSLQTSQMSRAAQTLQRSAVLAAHGPDATVWTEGMELAGATYKRVTEMQKSWLNEWSTWASYAQSLQGADTVPKYFERIGNIALQAQTQMNTQTTEMSELMDNIAVSYSYWLERKIDAQKAG